LFHGQHHSEIDSLVVISVDYDVFGRLLVESFDMY